MAVLDANEIMFKAFEPKVQNRFIMYFEDIPSFMVKAASAPSFSDEQIKLDHINSYRKIRGKREWNDLSLTLYDPITPSGAQAVMEWVSLSHESLTGRDGYADFYKKDIQCYMLGPVGDKIEQWTLKGAFINNAVFNDLDWANATDPAEITLTLSYDYAVLEF